jgi:hypothetical protein
MIEKGSIVDFVDETGKTKIGEVLRRIKRGRLKGWYKIKSHKNGKEKIYTVDEAKEIQNDGIS